MKYAKKMLDSSSGCEKRKYKLKLKKGVLVFTFKRCFIALYYFNIIIAISIIVSFVG